MTRHEEVTTSPLGITVIKSKIETIEEEKLFEVYEGPFNYFSPRMVHSYVMEDKGTVFPPYRHLTESECQVQCIAGKACCLVVDLNPNSPTYKEIETYTITDSNYIVLYIPNNPNIFIGYMALEDNTRIQFWTNKNVYGLWGGEALSLEDKSINLPWPIKVNEESSYKGGYTIEEIAGFSF